MPFALALHPAFRQPHVISRPVASCCGCRLVDGRCAVDEKTNLLASFGGEVACVGLQVCLFFVYGVSIVNPIARNLSDGAQSLGGGVKSLSSGAISLDGGVKSLSSGAISLDGGAKSLSGGEKSLDGGTISLSVGAKSLDGGVKRLGGGAISLSVGAKSLSGGR